MHQRVSFTFFSSLSLCRSHLRYSSAIVIITTASTGSSCASESVSVSPCVLIKIITHLSLSLPLSLSCTPLERLNHLASGVTFLYFACLISNKITPQMHCNWLVFCSFCLFLLFVPRIKCNSLATVTNGSHFQGPLRCTGKSVLHETRGEEEKRRRESNSS